MVYVYVKKSVLNKYLKEKLSVEQIEETLKDMGMDLKGIKHFKGDQNEASEVSSMDLKGISTEDDPELKVELTAEKLDMISPVGIARAINYYRGFITKLPEYKIVKGTNEVIVEKSVESIRGKTVAVIVRDVPMNQEFLDEIIEIQEKIHASFGRNRKKAAIGIYPIDNISFPIKYRAEEPKNIIFRPLESEIEMNGFSILENHNTGKKFAHLLKGFKLFPVYRDSKNKVLSMPPIINSYDTGRVETHNKDLFIELTGNNLQHLDNILKVLVTTFIEMGAKAESVLVKYENTNNYELNLNSTKDSLSLNYINKLIGTNLTINNVSALLPKVIFGFDGNNKDIINVEIPCFKSDVFNDVDIADDIARAYGYNNIIPSFPNISTIGTTLKISDFKEDISNIMTNLGFTELYTYMLTSNKFQFKNMLIEEDKNQFIKLQNSEDQGLNMVRTMILPDNLESLRINRKNKYPQKIFENGFTIQHDLSCDTGARNEANLSVSIADPKSNYTQIKEILDTFAKLNLIEFELKNSNKKYLIEGRCADIYMKNELVGFIGEISPQVLSNFNLLVPISSMELNLGKIFELKNK